MKISVEHQPATTYYGFDKGAEMVKTAGFAAVDWNLCANLNRPKIWKGDLSQRSIFDEDLETAIKFYQPQVDAFKKYGLEIAQAHAPFPSIVADRPHVMQYSIRILKRCIEVCDHFGVKNLVIHGTNLFDWDIVNTQKEIDELNFEFFSSLIPFLKGTCVTVCIEDLFSDNNRLYVDGICANPYKAAKLVDDLNALCKKEKHFGICLDSGHLNLMHGDFLHYIETVGKRIRCLHLHDNGGTRDDHKMPYMGYVPWEHLLKGLKAIGYDGYMNFETFNQYERETLPEELMLSAMKTTAACGRYFVKYVTGKGVE